MGNEVSNNAELSNHEKKVNSILNVYRYCAFNKNLLNCPIVSDYSGKLYNKEEILKQIIINKKGKRNEKDEIIKMNEDIYKSFNSINQFVNLNILLDKNVLKCPISEIEINIENENDVNQNKNLNDIIFCYIVPCGCVMNFHFLKQLIDFDETELNKNFSCPVCNKRFESSNLIKINPTDLKLQEYLKKRIQTLTAQSKYHNLESMVKKKKKRKLHKEEPDSSSRSKKIKKSE